MRHESGKHALLQVKPFPPGCAGIAKQVSYGRRKYRRPLTTKIMNPEDAKLSALLRQSRISPSLPPRFQENVWRRIEDAEAKVKPDTWLDLLAALVLRPKFAMAIAVVLVVAGAAFGARQGDRLARQDAQSEYMTAVAPPALR